MKKRIIVFLTILALSACLFAISVNADDIYSDFAKPGVNGEAPIFSMLGHSVDESAGNMCVEYKVDRDALAKYEKDTGKSLKFGVVLGYKDYIENDKPLDSKGKPTGANSSKIYSVDMSGETSTIISVLITGLDASLYERELAFSLYVIEEAGVKYVTDGASQEKPELVSYIKARGEVTIGNITYSIDGVTEPAWDRIRQQNESNAEYNTGSYLSKSELQGSGWFNTGILGKAKLIAAGGSLINMPAASDFMSHYLKNTGETYNINVASFLKDDSGALTCRNTAINNALRASEALAREGKTLTINQLTEGHPMQGQLATQNWQYAVGSYFDDVDVKNLTVTTVDGVKTYSATITYIVTDFYNWDTRDTYKFKQIVSPHELHELHKAGLAREFLSYGEISYNVTWTQGQTVDQISAFN